MATLNAKVMAVNPTSVFDPSLLSYDFPLAGNLKLKILTVPYIYGYEPANILFTPAFNSKCLFATAYVNSLDGSINPIIVSNNKPEAGGLKVNINYNGMTPIPQTSFELVVLAIGH
jgi:hypothetical protein